MSDLISRQAAIDMVEKESQVDGAYGYMDTKSIVDLLNDLPSAQPERKKGKWIEINDGLITGTCSVCVDGMLSSQKQTWQVCHTAQTAVQI